MSACGLAWVSAHHCLPVSSAPYSRPSCTLVSRGVGTRDSERRDRGMRRRRRRGDVVVLEESDESADEVQIMEPVPEG